MIKSLFVMHSYVIQKEYLETAVTEKSKITFNTF